MVRSHELSSLQEDVGSADSLDSWRWRFEGILLLHAARQGWPPNLRARVLADTETATGWVYAAVSQIAGKETGGALVQPTV